MHFVYCKIVFYNIAGWRRAIAKMCHNLYIFTILLTKMKMEDVIARDYLHLLH